MRSQDLAVRYQGGVPREAGRAASSPRAAEGVGRMEGGAAGAAKALGASVSPGGAVEAGEGTRARPVGLEARSREGALQGRALQTGCFCRGAGPQQSVLKGPVPQEEGLADSFSAFSEFGLQLLQQLRDYFPATNSTAVYRLELLLKWVQPLICGWGVGAGELGGCSRFPGVGVGVGGLDGAAPSQLQPLAQVSWQAAALPAFV